MIVLKHYVVTINITDYGRVIVLVDRIISNYHIMSSRVRINSIMSTVMDPIALHNYMANADRIEPKIKVVNIIIF
jgi:hypothetical protein